MRLANYTDYTLRVSIQRAVRPRDLATIGENADSYGSSENHPSGIVHRLGAPTRKPIALLAMQAPIGLETITPSRAKT